MCMHIEGSHMHVSYHIAVLMCCSDMCLRGSYCGAAEHERTPELLPNAAQRAYNSIIMFHATIQYNAEKSICISQIQAHVFEFSPLFPLVNCVCGVFCGCLRAVNTLMHRHGAKANRQQLLGLTALLFPPRSPPAPPPASTQLLASSASVAPITHTNRQHA